MRVTISIECDNAAFGNNDMEAGHEAAQILRGAALRLEHRGILSSADSAVRDADGNTVGFIKVED